MLRVHDLSIARASQVIIDGLSFSTAAGEALLLTGPNGAGKTTLLRAIAGLIRPETGSITIEGVDAEATVAEQCHFVGHLNAVKPSLTAVENLRFWATCLGRVVSSGPAGAGIDPTYEVGAALERVGLGALGGVPASYLSAGQKRRLGLARLLVAARPIWLLDEPTVSLDAASVAAFAGIIAEQLAGGGIVVAATHVPLGIAGARELKLGESAGAA